LSGGLYRTLQWLPAPADFNGDFQAIAGGAGMRGAAVRALANHALGEVQLKRLATLIGKLRSEPQALSPLVPFRLGVIGNGTLDLIAPALVATAARHGFDLDCRVSDYGVGMQEALAPDSAINQAACDAVLMAFDHRGLGLAAAPGEAQEARRRVEAALDAVRRMQASLHAHAGAHVIVQTLAAPPETLFGSLDRTLPGTLASMVDSFNRALAGEDWNGAATVLDVAGLAQTVGLADWYAPTQWNLAKLPFADDCAPLYADHVCRLIGALRGRSRRVLVLDLDNTLWGGVIGDDGLEGIAVGEGDATGEAFTAVQRLALELRGRGVILAVSSKNTDAVARRPFREHPDMVLREEHIAVFQANWDDKATNIQAIAEALSLGLESIVFLDDNPAERALVRRYLPQVAVPELPEDPALYARTLSAAGYFEAVAFTDEDRKRAGFYEDNARRAALGAAIADVDEYVAALDMEIAFASFDALNRSRITQLINKSNQFNLTTRRYSAEEVCALEEDPGVFTLQVRLKDRFGDNGMICVVICRPDKRRAWRIDTWLMSCRVLGRGVERLVLQYLLERARAAGVATVVGEYRPTERNGMVRGHYEKLGFAARGGDEDGVTHWAISSDVVVEVPPARRVTPTARSLLPAA
jgi:FkbH-like protein